MNVIVIAITFIPSILLCGHCQLDYLEKQGKINYRFIIAHFLHKQDIEWADVIVFLRSDSDIEAYVSKIAKKTGKHTIYVLDDNLLDVPSYLSSAPNYNMPSTKRNIRTIMANCDTFLTPSPVLLEKYGGSFKNKFLISEPSLNRIIKKEPNDKVKIGFAGSIDRTQDLNQLLEGAITKIVQKYGDAIEIEFMGAKPNFVEKLGLKHLPYQDGYDAYTAFMSKCNWDIGLAPMPDTPFHRCKYFNKYVEYASFGIVGIYSNLEPYIYGIRNEENGLLVNNTTEDWFNGISRLIEDTKLRRRISDNCLKEANEIYALDILAEDYYQKMLIGYNPNVKKLKIGSLEPVKFVIFWKRVYRKIKEQGTNFPNWFKKKLEKKKEEYKEKQQNKKNYVALLKLISNKDAICVIGPYNDIGDRYSKRIKDVDKALDGLYRIYLNGEDRSLENIAVSFVDESHAVLTFNSFDAYQTKEVLSFIEKCHSCIIHSIIRFMREKISPEMFEMFNLANVTKIWDVHGTIPENFHEAANFHTEKITNDIEKIFYDKADVIIVDNEKLISHFNKKYYPKDNKYIVYQNGDGSNEIKDNIYIKK